jgi:hypothetical protein
MDLRAQRRARNEAFFQGLSETVGRFHSEYSNRRLRFACECGSPTCGKKLSLTQEEYGIVRHAFASFVVAIGHDDPKTEEVLMREPGRFVVVEADPPKIAEPRELHG